MGCATSMCSCTQTAVATVTPRAPSHAHINSHPNGPEQRKSAGSSKSRLAPSLISVSKKSSQWSSYDLEIRDFDEFSDGDPLRGPCEIESDDEIICDDSLIDRYNNNNKGGHHHQLHSHNSHPNSLLSENSKWTVTVRLYANKAADQRSNDIPSVEETGSHYSSGEWHGKSGSSQGSRDSAKRPPKPPAPTPNGIIPKEYQKSKQKTVSKKSARSNRLHHSNSERPLTKEELAQHERMQLQQALNPTYAWGRGHTQSHGLGPPAEVKTMPTVGHKNGLIPPNGFSVLQGAPQKYSQPSTLSTYLSLGTNHYRQARSSLRERRRDPDAEDNWQSLCDNKIPPSRPRSSHHTHRQLQYREFNDLCDADSAMRSPSPIDSLLTDYIADGEIVEDFSGSTHSLTNVGVRTPTKKVAEHRPDQEVCMESQLPVEMKKQALRPRAALRRHRSEPFHFLV